MVGRMPLACQELEQIAGDLPGVARRQVAALAYRSAGESTEQLAIIFVPCADAGAIDATTASIRSALARRAGVAPAA
jgi:hypothetical protein